MKKKLIYHQKIELIISISENVGNKLHYLLKVLLITSAKISECEGASHHSAFMVNPSIISQTC